MASGMLIILGCKLTSGRRGVSHTVRSAPRATSRGIASTARACCSGTRSDSPLLALFSASFGVYPLLSFALPSIYKGQGVGLGGCGGLVLNTFHLTPKRGERRRESPPSDMLSESEPNRKELSGVQITTDGTG